MNIFKMMSICAVFLLTACMTNKEVAEERRYHEPRFSAEQPIKLKVSEISVVSEFTPAFTKPNVEHLFPVSLEKSAQIWANDRLLAADPLTDRVAEFVIKDASVTEEEVKASQLFHKDSLKYRASLSVVLKISSSNGSSAQTALQAWRELNIPIDTQIDQKEEYWNEMIQKLMNEFNQNMEKNIHEHLNMYVFDNSLIYEY